MVLLMISFVKFSTKKYKILRKISIKKYIFVKNINKNKIFVNIFFKSKIFVIIFKKNRFLENYLKNIYFILMLKYLFC